MKIYIVKFWEKGEELPEEEHFRFEEHALEYLNSLNRGWMEIVEVNINSIV